MMRRTDRGSATVLMLMAIGLCAALATGLFLTSSVEVTVASQFRDQRAAFYAAEAIVERALVDLAALGDWTPAIAGTSQSGFIDGPPSGPRRLDDGSSVNLPEVVNMASCFKTSACSPSDLSAVTLQRPWGAANPRWMPFAYGRLRDLLTAESPSPFYVVALVAAHPVRPERAVALRGEAFGPRNAHAIVELTAGRPAAETYNGGEVVGGGAGPGAGGSAVGIAAGNGIGTSVWREVR